MSTAGLLTSTTTLPSQEGQPTLLKDVWNNYYNLNNPSGLKTAQKIAA